MILWVITGEGTLVAGEVNTASLIWFTVEMMCALVIFMMGSMFNYSVEKAHLFQFMHK